MGESPSRAPHGLLSNWSRLGVAFVFFGTTASVLLVGLLFLLPWRRARLRAGGTFANFVGPRLLWILGIDLQIEGRERIEAATPAVFMINHTSVIDTLVGMTLWPRLACGIGKIEVLWVPFFGAAYALTGNLFINRRDRASAIRSIDGLVAIVNTLGLSPWIAPEGTRSLDGELAPFKKGFAHIALATGLPVVPMVIHGAYGLWPPRTFRITPGTVRVQILEPIPTTGWSPHALDAHVAQVRGVFEAALEHPSHSMSKRFISR